MPGYQISPACLGLIVQQVMGLVTGGRVAVVVEATGRATMDVCRAIEVCGSALLGDDLPPLPAPARPPAAAAVATVKEVLLLQSRHWPAVGPHLAFAEQSPVEYVAAAAAQSAALTATEALASLSMVRRRALSVGATCCLHILPVSFVSRRPTSP